MPEKVLSAVLRILEYGAGSSQDISDELGISVKSASAHLTVLRELGLIEKFGEQMNTKHRVSIIYKLK